MKINNTILIKSTIEEVWEKTIDIETWPSWNPIMNSVTRQKVGELTVGSTAQIDQQGMKPAIWTINELSENETFSWQTKLLGMNLVATHKLSQDGDHVINDLSLSVSGFMGKILWPLLKAKFEEALINENEHFKRYCEK